MENKRKIEIIVAVLVIVGLLVLLFFVLRPTGDQTLDEDTTEQIDDSNRREVDRVSTVSSRTTESPPEVIARSFVERFASYSTDVDYLNVEDVKPLATAILAGRLDQIVEQARAAESGSYYGVSTRVISIEPVSEEEEAVSFVITTQRQESIDSPSNSAVRYQDIEVELVKNSERWLVNDFAWNE